MPLPPALFNHDIKKIDFGSLPWTITEGHKDFRSLEFLLAQILAHRAVADRIPFGEQLTVHASGSHALLGRRASVPLGKQGINPSGGGVQDRTRARLVRHPAGGRHLKVFVYSGTTQAQFMGHLLDADTFDEHFVMDDMNRLHAEHSFPPVAEIRAQPYRNVCQECSVSECQTVHCPISATITRK
jgi:hypothetical protein